ncbi:MAG: hypothetical protein AAGG07_00580 [Planctomycetota bacterium]
MQHSPLSLFWSLASTALVAAAASTSAAQNATPYTATVIEDALPLRCGDMDRFYAVAELPRGTVLTVVSEVGNWAEVRYPSDLGAFVSSAEVRLSDDGSAVRLERASRLRAAHMTAGPTGSWKPLLNDPVPAGTVLNVIEVVKGRDDRAFFRVEAPESATGFVVLTGLSAAIGSPEPADPVADPGAELASEPASDEDTPDSVPETTEPEQTPAPVPGAVPGSAPGSEPAAGQPDDMTPSEQIDTSPTRSEPTETTPATTTPSNTSPASEPATEPARRPAASPSEPMTDFQRLDMAFRAAVSQPVQDAELDGLIAEHRRASEALEPTDRNESLRQSLERRIAALELRRDYRDRLRASEAADDRLAEQRERLQRRLEALGNAVTYAAVGRLTVSTLYDGQALPEMYRVRSLDSDTPRTLGYIEITDENRDDFRSKLGMPVGIVGAIDRDSRPGVRMIMVRRMDIIDPAVFESDAEPSESN